MTKNIVLVHGWGSSSTKLLGLATSLAKLGWQVFTPPLPGFEIEAPKSVWGVPEYANYVYESALEHFVNKPFTVFGHSFGGRVAIFLGAHKKRYLQSLVLCAASGVTRKNKFVRRLFMLGAKVGKGLVGTGPRILFKKYLYKLSREHDYEKLEGLMKKVFQKVVDYDAKIDAPSVYKPTLIVWGTRDRLTPLSDAKILKSLIHKSKIVLFDGFGHRLPYDNPTGVARKINEWCH